MLPDPFGWLDEEEAVIMREMIREPEIGFGHVAKIVLVVILLILVA